MTFTEIRRGLSKVTMPVWVLVFGLLIRLALIAWTPNYEGDELEMALSVLDRWMGLAPTTLAWPAVPLEIAAFLVKAPIFLFSMATDSSLDRLARTLAASYADPSGTIIAIRCLSALVAAGAAALVYRIVAELTKDNVAAFLAAFVVTFLPLSLRQSMMATTDASAYFFLVLTVYFILVPPMRPFYAGLAAAAAIATKILIVFWLAPVLVTAFVLAVQQKGPREAVRSAALFCVAGAGGLVFLVPWIWIDPLRLLKSLAGELITKRGVVTPSFEFAQGIVVSGTVLLVVLGLVTTGIAVLFLNQAKADRNRLWLAVLAAMTALVFFYFSWNGAMYLRYLLGAIVPLSILLSMLFHRLGPNVKKPLAIGVALLVFVPAVIGEIDVRRSVGLRYFFQTVQAACEQGVAVWIQDRVLEYRFDAQPVPGPYISQIVSHIDSPVRREALSNKLGWAGIGPHASIVLRGAFDEDDEAASVRWKLLEAYTPQTMPCDFHIFGTSGSGKGNRPPEHVSLSDDTVDTLRKAFSEQAAPAIILAHSSVVAAIGMPVIRQTDNMRWTIAGWGVDGTPVGP